VGMSGRTHDKGVQILTGFLRGHFARTRTLALKASICFEQSYVRIDGDSASTAELLALISAIARVPLRQAMAITGSVDQLGNVQTIGGVNEKIEGFFRTCREEGFTGEQGVLIPETNVPDLMLSEEVCDACAAGDFHVWPVSRVEEALALLTGRPVASAADPDSWKEGGVFALVVAALDEMEATVRKASRGK
jgi:predicted ATP-dependent protease